MMSMYAYIEKDGRAQMRGVHVFATRDIQRTCQSLNIVACRSVASGSVSRESVASCKYRENVTLLVAIKIFVSQRRHIPTEQTECTQRLVAN